MLWIWIALWWAAGTGLNLFVNIRVHGELTLEDLGFCVFMGWAGIPVMGGAWLSSFLPPRETVLYRKKR